MQCIMLQKILANVLIRANCINITINVNIIAIIDVDELLFVIWRNMA